MKKSEFLKQGNYLTVIKPLAHQIGLEETILLMELVGMEEYKEQKHLMFKEIIENENRKNNPNKAFFDESSRAFECTATELELATTIKRKKQISLIKKMNELHLLKTEQRGLPAKRFIILNHDEIDKLVDKAISEYQEFKDHFFQEERKELQEQMNKRKGKKTQKTLLSSKGTTDNTNGFTPKKEGNHYSNQLSSKGTTSFPKEKQLVEPNEDSLNNTSSLKISDSKNNPSIINERIENLDIPESIKKVLYNKIDGLMDFNFNLNEIVLNYKAYQEQFTENQYAHMLNIAITEVKQPIKKTANFLEKVVKNYLEKRTSKNPNYSKKNVRKDKLPKWLEKEKQQNEQSKKEGDQAEANEKSVDDGKNTYDQLLAELHKKSANRI